MSQSRCIVETVKFGQEEAHMLSLPEMILQREDIALVAAGSLSCIRDLYDRARQMGRLGQFFPCVITKEEYAAGLNGRKLGECLNRVLKAEGVGGIIIYASCMEVITQTDFDEIIRNLDNPEQIPVEVLYRGPMVKRYLKPAAMLEEILGRMPIGQGKLCSDYRELPPVYPDFNGISAMLQHWDALPFLITAGGCTGGLARLEEDGRPYRLNNSRLTDIQVTLGCEELLENGIAYAAGEMGTYTAGKAETDGAGSHMFVCLLGSAVPAFTGVDYTRISRNLKKGQVPNIHLASDGFGASPAGASDALLALGKELLVPVEKEEGRINILGYSPAAVGRVEKIRHGMEHLERRGFHSRVWGDGGLPEVKKAAAAGLNWVVSGEGLALARWMERTFSIPYLAGIPMGVNAMLDWRKQVNLLMGRDDELLEPPGPVPAAAVQPRILVTGEPLLARSIARALKEDFGYGQVMIALYAPVPSLRNYYRDVLGETGWIGFADTDEFLRLAKQADLVVGDPVYQDCLDMLGKERNVPGLIPIPDSLVSGGQYLDMEYEIFGRKGGEYMRRFLNETMDT